jgi:hypothetical protein
MLKVLGAFAILIGVFCIYNERALADKFFVGLQEERAVVYGIKVFGTLVVILGGLLIIL